jgi:ubiquinone/menaquinone biosynthesis C-methylase UbiE
MIAVARRVGDLDPRVRLQEAAVEQLPFPDERFDLVVSSLSFDHWGDQGQGLREVARVLTPEGRLGLVSPLISCPLRTTRRRTGSTLDALLHLALTGTLSARCDASRECRKAASSFDGASRADAPDPG